MSAALPRPYTASHQIGLSLIELVLFMVIVSAALAGVTQVFVQTTANSADPLSRRQALAIAESLLEEVQLMAFSYCDSDDANVETATSTAGCAGLAEAMGPEPGETRFTTLQFDNVNDYHDYSMSGIVDITDTPVLNPNLTAYSASVDVSPAALGSITSASGDALRITVSVTAPDGTKIELDGYRSRYAPNAAL